MKKTFLISLALLGICVPLASCGEAKDTEIAKLFYAYSSENLMGDWDYLSEKYEDGEIIEENKKYRNRDHTLRFSLMKGENEGVQLIVNAKKYINEFDFILPSVSDGTHTISASNFSVAAAWYQMVSGSNERGAYSGYYPDALIPLVNYKFRRMNHIEKDRNQSIYINFVSTEDMIPGTYTGVGTLSLDGQVFDIPFEVTIYDAVMPKEVHQKSSYLIWYDQIPLGELENSGPLMDLTYYNFIVSKRLTPSEIPPALENDPESFAENFAQLVAYNDAITTHRFPVQTSFVSFDNKTDYTIAVTAKFKRYLQALINKNLEIRDADPLDDVDFFKKIFLYVDDEPSASSYDKVKTDDQIWYELKKELAPQLNRYPDLKESFLNMHNLVTTPLNDNLYGNTEEGGVSCWCPQYSQFATAEARANYAARKALPKDGNYKVKITTATGVIEKQGRVGGEDVWWYGCMDPSSPFPSLHLDADLLNTRTIRYMQYDYDISGCLFWNVCYYSKYSGGSTSGRDIWYDPISWARCAGDGQLVYPGVTYGIDGPITTLRLEQLLASSEEYEYLWMIEQGVNEYNEEHGTEYNAREKLQQKYFSRIYHDMICGNDHALFNDVRIELLKLVTKMSNNRDAAVEELVK